MATVARDPRDGRWLARWRDPGGRQRKRSFDRKVDAQRWLDQMRADMHRGQYIDPRAGSVRLREVAAAWAGGLAQLKESTAVRYAASSTGTYCPPSAPGSSIRCDAPTSRHGS